jgi:hypothetical protein
MSKDANRNAMPTVAGIVDEWRKAFPDLKVVYASENGHTLDRREPETNVFDIPPDYCKPYTPKEKK